MIGRIVSYSEWRAQVERRQHIREAAFGVFCAALGYAVAWLIWGMR